MYHRHTALSRARQPILQVFFCNSRFVSVIQLPITGPKRKNRDHGSYGSIAYKKISPPLPFFFFLEFNRILCHSLLCHDKRSTETDSIKVITAITMSFLLYSIILQGDRGINDGLATFSFFLVVVSLSI